MVCSDRAGAIAGSGLRQGVGVEREGRGDVCVGRHGDDAVVTDDGAVGAPAGRSLNQYWLLR